MTIAVFHKKTIDDVYNRLFALIFPFDDIKVVRTSLLKFNKYFLIKVSGKRRGRSMLL